MTDASLAAAVDNSQDLTPEVAKFQSSPEQRPGTRVGPTQRLRRAEADGGLANDHEAHKGLLDKRLVFGTISYG
jgi:hypothetical protein